MMMNRFDLGGCCLARYGAATPYFASKTDQIMSKYRPIAPKPVVQSTGGVVDGLQQPQPLPPPVENSSRIRSSTRTRKRSWDAANATGAASSSPRAHKRAVRSRASGSEAVSGNSEGHQHQSAKSCVVLGNCSQTTLRPHSDTSEGGRGGGLTLCDISDSAGSKNFGLGRSSLGYSSSSCTSFESSLVTHKNDGMVEKDAAFMERAAASASSGLPERKPINNQAVIVQTSVMEAASALDASNSHTQQDLITLPLLPITPSPYRRESPTRSSRDTISLRMQQNQPLYSEEVQSHKIMIPRSPLVDISLLDHLYSASSDPVILTDDSYAHRVIWYNSAYKRLVSASEVRIPTPLASFKQPFTSSAAILWGFSNKYSTGGGVQGMMEVKKGGLGVIMPQPMRPVGSSVVVECITDTNLEASPITDTIQVVEEQLDSQSSPCLISDSNNRVRWANSAYKQMIGQPECSWLDTPDKTTDHNKKSVKVTRIHGEVLLVFNLDRFHLEEHIAAFSCRVKIQWTNGGEKSSMTVPCDVVKINGNGESTDLSYAWQFDIQAALSL